MTYLTGIALSHFEHSIELEEDMGVVEDWSTDWQKFMKELRSHFGLPDRAGEAAERLGLLRMKPRDKIASYNVEFQRYSSQLRWGDEALAFHYYKGLPNRLQDPISSREKGKPKRFQRLLEVATKYDARYWERDREKARVQAAEEEITSRKKKANTPSTQQSSSKPNTSANAAQAKGNTPGTFNKSHLNPSNNPKSTSGGNAPSSNASSSKPAPKKVDLSDKLGKDGKLTPEERNAASRAISASSAATQGTRSTSAARSKRRYLLARPPLRRPLIPLRGRKNNERPSGLCTDRGSR